MSRDRCPTELRAAPRCRIRPDPDPENRDAEGHPGWICVAPGCGAWGPNVLDERQVATQCALDARSEVERLSKELDAARGDCNVFAEELRAAKDLLVLAEKQRNEDVRRWGGAVARAEADSEMVSLLAFAEVVLRDLRQGPDCWCTTSMLTGHHSSTCVVARKLYASLRS